MAWSCCPKGDGDIALCVAIQLVNMARPDSPASTAETLVPENGELASS